MPKIVLDLDCVCTSSSLYQIDKNALLKLQNSKNDELLILDDIKDTATIVKNNVTGICPYHKDTSIVVKSVDDNNKPLTNSVLYVSARNENYSKLDGISLLKDDLALGLYLHIQKLGKIKDSLYVYLDKKPIRAKTMVKDIHEKHSVISIPTLEHESHIVRYNELISSFLWKNKYEFLSTRTHKTLQQSKHFTLDKCDNTSLVATIFEIRPRFVNYLLYKKPVKFCNTLYVYKDKDKKTFNYTALGLNKNYYVSPFYKVIEHFLDKGLKI